MKSWCVMTYEFVLCVLYQTAIFPYIMLYLIHVRFLVMFTSFLIHFVHIMLYLSNTIMSLSKRICIGPVSGQMLAVLVLGMFKVPPHVLYVNKDHNTYLAVPLRF